MLSLQIIEKRKKLEADGLVQLSLLVAQLQGPCWGSHTFCGVEMWTSVLSPGWEGGGPARPASSPLSCPSLSSRVEVKRPKY